MRKFSRSLKKGPSSRVSRIRGGNTPETTYMRPQARRQIVYIWCSSWALRRVKARVQRKRLGVASRVGAGCPSGFKKRRYFSRSLKMNPSSPGIIIRCGGTP